MTIKFDKSSLLLRGTRVREDKEFDQVLLTPDASDSEASQEFISIVDVTCNTATLTEASDALDGDGQLVLEANYCLDMESAIRANIRKIKFEIHVDDPAPKTSPASSYRPGTREYINESMRRTLAFDSSSTPGSRSDRPSATLGSFIGSLIKSFEVNTDVTDQMVQTFRGSERSVLSLPRKSVASSPAMQEVSNLFPQVTQVYSVLSTTDLRLTATDKLSRVQVEGAKGLTNLIDSRLLNGTADVTPGTVQEISRRALLRGIDPMSHVGMFYATGPTATESSPGQPVRYSSDLLGQNEVRMSYRGREADNRFTSVLPSNAQVLTSQRTPDFKGDADIEALYKKSASISSTPAIRAAFMQESVRSTKFASTFKQFLVEFDLSFLAVRPKVNRFIWVKVDLLDKDGKTYKTKTYKVDIRKQLKGLLTPTLPPVVKIISQQEGKIELLVEQRDLLATDFSLYRMSLRPEDLSESVWTKVLDFSANTRRGAVKYVDSTVVSNVDPNLTVYEVRCSGLFGSVCPNTSRVFKKGVKRTSNLTKSRRRGACNIIAIQNGKSIQIRVSKVPAGVTRIFLRKQIINNALKERDIRKLPTVRAMGSDRDYHDVTNTSGIFMFEDNDVVNRQEYRYVAQFDWIESERTTSVSEDYIEYRRVPDRPINSYLRNVKVDADTRGRAVVSFELGASFTDAGIDELNRILGSTGTSSLFTEELRKDRSYITNSLLFQVTRKNVRTNERVVWSLVEQGTFIDSQRTRSSASIIDGAGYDDSPGTGNDYVYMARLHIVNPERFFKEALTRIPATTRQTILDADPNFIEFSSAKFAENFAIRPGSMLSPTTLEKETNFSLEVQGAYTGISHSAIVEVPIVKAIPSRVATHRSVSGRAANVVRWTVAGTPETVYAFQVDITIGNDRTFPLAAISPTISEDAQYEIRDDLFVNEIVPITYTVTAVYNDMTRSPSVRSGEIYAKSTLPVSIFDQAIRRSVVRNPEYFLGAPGVPSYTTDRPADSFVTGPTSIGGELDVERLNRIRTIRNSMGDTETRRTLLDNNPIRRSREP